MNGLNKRNVCAYRTKRDKCREVIRAYCVVKTVAERQRSGSDWRHTAAFAAGVGVFYFAAAFYIKQTTMSNKAQFTNILEAALQKRGLTLSDAYRQTSEYTPKIAAALYEAATASRLWNDEQVGKWPGVSVQVVKNRYKMLKQ